MCKHGRVLDAKALLESMETNQYFTPIEPAVYEKLFLSLLQYVQGDAAFSLVKSMEDSNKPIGPVILDSGLTFCVFRSSCDDALAWLGKMAKLQVKPKASEIDQLVRRFAVASKVPELLKIIKTIGQIQVQFDTKLLEKPLHQLGVEERVDEALEIFHALYDANVVAEFSLNESFRKGLAISMHKPPLPNQKPKENSQ